MNWKKGFVVLIALVILLIVQQFWHWEVERIEVPPEKCLILMHRWGRDLPPDQIIAPDDSYKGVQLEPLQTGRHFLNPLFWSYEVADLVKVNPGECLVLCRKYGLPPSKERLERGDILASVPYPVPEGMRGQEDRGIVPNVLPPGAYYLNPYAYSWQKVAAVQVAVEQVGVRTLKVGKDPRELPADRSRSRYVVPDGYRGVQAEPVPAGTHYINPYVESITPVGVRSHRVELTDIEFPSRDGFILKPHVVVEYAVRPEKAPELLVRLADEGILYQEDLTPEQQARNVILQKVILPHIRGYARISGSNFDARDFIVVTGAADVEKRATNNREALQKALETKVKPRCEELGIEVRAVTLAELVPPKELADQISQRELARVEQEKNKVMLRQLKAAQDLKAKEALKQQAKELVEAGTQLNKAKVEADQQKEVEQLRLEQDLKNAETRLAAAQKQAEATLTTGKAEAAVIELENEAEIAGVKRAMEGFPSPQQFAMFHVLAKLGPALTEIFASDDSEFARLLSGYLAPPRGSHSNMPLISEGASPPAVKPASDTKQGPGGR